MVVAQSHMLMGQRKKDDLIARGEHRFDRGAYHGPWYVGNSESFHFPSNVWLRKLEFEYLRAFSNVSKRGPVSYTHLTLPTKRIV